MAPTAPEDGTYCWFRRGGFETDKNVRSFRDGWNAGAARALRKILRFQATKGRRVTARRGRNQSRAPPLISSTPTRQGRALGTPVRRSPRLVASVSLARFARLGPLYGSWGNGYNIHVP